MNDDTIMMRAGSAERSLIGGSFMTGDDNFDDRIPYEQSVTEILIARGSCSALLKNNTECLKWK